MKDVLKPTMWMLAAAVILLPSSLILSCSKGDAKETRGAAGGPAGGRRNTEFPVEVRAVESRNVEYSVTAVGSLDAFERVNFREGQLVKAGQPLVEIEPERYRLAVAAA